MSESMKARIQKMYLGDAVFACGFLIVLWVVYFFVYLSIPDRMLENGIATVLLIGGALVLVFNTAAIVAMIVQYAREKTIIYGLDIRHLDEMRAARNRP